MAMDGFLGRMQGFPLAQILGRGGAQPMMGAVSPTSQTPASPMAPGATQTAQMPMAGKDGAQQSPQGMNLMQQMMMAHGGMGGQQQNPQGFMNGFAGGMSPGISAMILNRMGMLTK